MLRFMKIALYLLTLIGFSALAASGTRLTEEKRLGPVTVTAQKKEEDIQKIPLTVSSFSDLDLEDAGIKNTMELVRFTPNVHMKKSTSENMISIRGITPFDSSIYSPTAFYVDDIPLPLHYMHNMDFYDLERIEVLKGPQGTLYGGNSESGVINVVTKKPGNESQGKVFTEFGVFPSIEDNPYSIKAGANLRGPMVEDRLFLGVAGVWEESEGFMTNLTTNGDDAGRMDRYNGRFSLVYTPLDTLEITLVSDALKNDDKIAVYRFDTGSYKTDPYEVRHEETDWSREDGNGQALRIKYAGSDYDFLSVTGRRDYTNENQQDYDCTADPMNNWGEIVSEYEDTIITQEFRISSRGDTPFSWLAGCYGFIEETRINKDNKTAGDRSHTEIDMSGYAFFAEGTYAFLERLHLTAGLRYDAQAQEGKQKRNAPDPMTYQPKTYLFDKDQEFYEFLPKFSIGYDVTRDIYAYTLVSKGYLMGGYNYVLATDHDSFSYDPEYVWNYEVGVKSAWLDNRVTANLSLFYLKIEDKQVYEQMTGSNPGTRVDNAARAHSKGIEAEITVRPARGLDLFGGLGIISARYDDWTATEWNADYTGFVKNDYKGKKLPNVPEYSFNLGMQYRFLNGLFIRTDINGVGDFYGDHANTVKENAYTLVNLRMGYETETFDIILWGKNIFDKQYHTIKYAWDGDELVQDSDPSSFGVTVNWRF